MITHLQRKAILTRHVKPETFAESKTAYGRELKLIAGITANNRYGDFAFWEHLGLGFQLNSLAWFKTPEGSAALERSWRLYRMSEAQRELYLAKEREELENLLDSTLNSTTIDETETPPQPERPVAKRRMNAMEWADSKTA